jgi:hypothetical protein
MSTGPYFDHDVGLATWQRGIEVGLQHQSTNDALGRIDRDLSVISSQTGPRLIHAEVTRDNPMRSFDRNFITEYCQHPGRTPLPISPGEIAGCIGHGDGEDGAEDAASDQTVSALLHEFLLNFLSPAI